MGWLTAKRISTFTNKPYAGNPAWVVIGASVTDDVSKLAHLASELNPISGAVFVFPGDESADVYLRFFSHSGEINFSGHGTLAAYFGMEGGEIIELTEPSTVIRQKTKTEIQPLELRVQDNKIERVTVSLRAPQFVSTPVDVKQISRLFGIPPVHIVKTTHPVGVVALSGCTDIVVPIESRDVLLNVVPNFQLIRNYCDRSRISGVVLYCLDTSDEKYTAHMRYFAPSVGMDEDPVSGAASASLGCYLVQNRLVPMKDMSRLVIEQGYSMNRPGVVYVHVYVQKNQIQKVTFGGQGVVTFEGRILQFED
jgi:PhzF family phenazine biosynthesis protein